MNTMKKLCTIAVAIILFAGCTKVDVPTPQPPTANAELKIFWIFLSSLEISNTTSFSFNIPCLFLYKILKKRCVGWRWYCVQSDPLNDGIGKWL